MIAVRAARPDDAIAIAAIYAPFVANGIITFEEDAPDADAIAARMAAGDGLYPWLVATEAEAVIAYAYASGWSPRRAYRWTAETTIYVAPAAHRRGTGRQLYGALLATLTAQGFHQALGRIALPNAASTTLHAALGFRPVGTIQAAGWKHGRWIDVETWQRPLAAVAAPPAEPRPFAALG